MIDLTKSLEWILTLARKAEESANHTYTETKRVTVKDKFTGEYSLRVRVGLNNAPLLKSGERDTLP